METKYKYYIVFSTPFCKISTFNSSIVALSAVFNIDLTSLPCSKLIVSVFSIEILVYSNDLKSITSGASSIVMLLIQKSPVILPRWSLFSILYREAKVKILTNFQIFLIEKNQNIFLVFLS